MDVNYLKSVNLTLKINAMQKFFIKHVLLKTMFQRIMLLQFYVIIYCNANVFAQFSTIEIDGLNYTSYLTDKGSKAIKICEGQKVKFIVKDNYSSLLTYVAHTGDGSSDYTFTNNELEYTYRYMNHGEWPATFRMNLGGIDSTINLVIHVDVCSDFECYNCIGSFSPEPGMTYSLSTWVKESGVSATTLKYNDAKVQIGVQPSHSNWPIEISTSGMIIDGWQRIDSVFTIPSGTTHLEIKLLNTGAHSVDCFFDDIRIHPLNGSAKTYVYDPVNLRLVAELDENNYATFYEYDEEGRLIRVKKETERGIMTIKESRNNTYKIPPSN